MLPFRPSPFFSNKNKAFWQLQAAGWGGALLLVFADLAARQLA